MRKVISPDTSYEARMRAIETGPYGRCVYRCDNTVVDHQVVSMLFPSGASVTLTMQGFSNVEGRTTRIDGTRATLHADEPSNEIRIYDHPALDALSQLVEVIRPVIPESGHGGGDFTLLAAFIKTLRGGEPALTTARASLESHLMAFAAEEARLTRSVVVMDEYRARVERAALAPA